MKDERFVYYQDVKDRKNLSRNSKYKKNGSRSRKCTLPSDYMTRKQKEELNGMVKSYTMNTLHPWSEVTHWPTDLRLEYLKKLLGMGANRKEIADVMGVHRSTIGRVLREGGIDAESTRPPRMTAEQKKAWLEFIGEKYVVIDDDKPEPESKPEPEKKVVFYREAWEREAKPVVVDAQPEDASCRAPGSMDMTPKSVEPATVCESLEVVFTGSMAEVIRALSLLPVGKGRHRITVRVE